MDPRTPVSAVTDEARCPGRLNWAFRSCGLAAGIDAEVSALTADKGRVVPTTVIAL